MGPNVKRLVIERASQLMAERGAATGDTSFGGVIAAMVAGGKDGIQADVREASKWVKNAMIAIRQSPGGEIYATDEDAAAELVRQIEKKRKASTHAC